MALFMVLFMALKAASFNVVYTNFAGIINHQRQILHETGGIV